MADAPHIARDALKWLVEKRLKQDHRPLTPSVRAEITAATHREVKQRGTPWLVKQYEQAQQTPELI